MKTIDFNYQSKIYTIVSNKNEWYIIDEYNKIIQPSEINDKSFLDFAKRIKKLIR